MANRLLNSVEALESIDRNLLVVRSFVPYVSLIQLAVVGKERNHDPMDGKSACCQPRPYR